MENLFNFLNNFRNNAAQWEQQASRDTANALNTLGNNMSQGLNMMASPFTSAYNLMSDASQRGAANEGRAIRELGNSIYNTLANGMSPVTNLTNPQAQQTTSQPTTTTRTANIQKVLDQTNRLFGAGNAISDSAKAATSSQNKNTAAGTTAGTAGNTYYREPGIDTFVNLFRMIMSPTSIWGLGENPLGKQMGDFMQDSLYTTFGTRTPAQNTAASITETPSIDGSGVTTAPATTNTPAKTEDSTDEVIAYTYQPGDTFGDVILKLGLNTNNGLWGTNGDVDYYTKQLIEQGIWPNGVNGNIPIGTTIKLRRRK